MALKQGLGADRMRIRSEAFRERLRALGYDRLAEVRREGDAEVPVEITDPGGRHIIAREAGRMGGKKGAGHKFKKGSQATRVAALLGLKKRWDNYRANERADLLRYKKELEEAGLGGERGEELDRMVAEKLSAEMGGKRGSREKYEARSDKSSVKQMISRGVRAREHLGAEALAEKALAVLPLIPREPRAKDRPPASGEEAVLRSIEAGLSAGASASARPEPVSELERDVMRSIGVDPDALAPSGAGADVVRTAAQRSKIEFDDE